MFTTVAEANTAIGRHPDSLSPLSENSKPIDTNAKVNEDWLAAADGKSAHGRTPGGVLVLAGMRGTSRWAS
jgi:hypothetical protein